MTKAFLHGIRVLDLSQYIPGPFATLQLADLGADVIKVEPPQGDPMRQFMHGDSAGGDSSPIYRHLNRGKRILALDLKSNAGRAALTDLLADADVLLESFRPGVMARLGFDRPTLQNLNPDLIHCALSGFGQTGPYRERAGHDLTYCAISGQLSGDSLHASPPITFPPLADHAGAMQAANAILAALVGKFRHASSSDTRGCLLDISLCESALSWQYLSTSSAQAQWILKGGLANYRLYSTADQRFVALAALEDKFWQAFCTAVGRADWLERPAESLPQHDLISEVQALFGSQPLPYWLNLLADVDCCFEPVPLLTEVATHPQMQQRQVLSSGQPAYPAWLNGEPLPVNAEPERVSHARWHS